MGKFGYVLITLSLFFLISSVFAAPPSIEIRNLSLPEGGWGEKKITFEVFNHEEYVKFIVLEYGVEFRGASGAYNSDERFCAHLEPGFWFRMEPDVTIPGNYGEVSVTLRFYDVVDTLDTVFPEQKFLDTSISMEVKMPESTLPWLDKAVKFPPRVDEHPYFDNQFVRLMYAMLAEGSSPADIAQITGADSNFVDATLKRMAGDMYIAREGQNTSPAFPVISKDEAEQVLKLVESTSDNLTAIIARNCAGYRQALESLIEAGILPGDSDNVLGPERVLFRPYVAVSALLLWNELGTQFISDGIPLALYTNTDLCNANIRDFMYAAPTDAIYHGHHFFTLETDGGSLRLLFAGHIPKIHCAGNFPRKPGIAAKAVWKYDSEDHPEYFLYSDTVAEPALEILKRDADEIIPATLTELRRISSGWGRQDLTAGYRYWFWNLVASRTLDSLVEQKVVEPIGTDNYILAMRGGM